MKNKNEKLIDYKLFYSRNKFNPQHFIEKKQIDSYQEFVRQLNLILIKSPGEEYYNRVISHIDKEKALEAEKEKALEAEKEKALEVEKEKALEVEKEKAYEETVKKKKRREKKKKTKKKVRRK